jgi:DNA (cytosine-5)-methyltransferase 1
MPRLLDLFCGAGGAAKGYREAGFLVVGVDHVPQPNYAGDEFIHADAIGWLDAMLRGSRGRRTFDAIHASPPCQAFTNARVIHGREHPDLLTPTRELLKETDLPWVIENVPGAPMRADLVLCGSHFGLGSDNGGLIRHRWFEFWEPQLVLVPSCQHRETTISVFGHGGHVYHGVEDWREVMGIDWMTRDELAQAIPPAFTKHVGEVLMSHLTATREEAA